MTQSEFDLTMSFMVKSIGTVGLSIYDFLLVSNSSHISHFYVTVQLLQPLENFRPSLIIRPNFRLTHYRQDDR